jgi:hypothetical protein
MGTQSGSSLINSVIVAGGAEVTSSTFPLGGKISLGIDFDIINGATPPASTAFTLIIEYQREASAPFFSMTFRGSLTANGIVPMRNLKIPYDAYAWRYRYVPAPDQNVTLKISQGGFLP